MWGRLVGAEAALGLEISHTPVIESVQYFTMPIRVPEGSILATKYVGVLSTDHELDTS